MAIGSGGEVGVEFVRGAHYPWVGEDGEVGYLMTGYASLCFIAGRPGNVYPKHEHVLVPPSVLDRDEANG